MQTLVGFGLARGIALVKYFAASPPECEDIDSAFKIAVHVMEA